ncbi:MAG TPA: DapH/DapD/GlmU-related protein [Nitrososphaerales archaeon]|nr:DapH/DapD/GlmU-related protein [Nitrososphaerales archaeon]
MGTDVVLSGKMALGESVQVWHHATVGFAFERKMSPCELTTDRRGANVTSLGNRSVISPYALVERGASIGDEVKITEFSRVGSSTFIGDRSIIEYGAKIYDCVSVGKDSVVGGFSCNDSKIGDRTTMMGILLHRYPRTLTSGDWENTLDRPPAPSIGNDVFVGFDTLVIGGVRIGDGARIGAGAIITRNVDKGSTFPNGYVSKK